MLRIKFWVIQLSKNKRFESIINNLDKWKFDIVKQVTTKREYGFQWTVKKIEDNFSLNDIITNDKNKVNMHT